MYILYLVIDLLINHLRAIYHFNGFVKTLWGVYVKKKTQTKPKSEMKRICSVICHLTRQLVFKRDVLLPSCRFHYYPINDVYHPVVDLNETDFLITLVPIHVYPYWNHTNRSKRFWLMKLWMWNRCCFFLNSTLEREYDKWATTPLVYDVLLLMTWTYCVSCIIYISLYKDIWEFIQKP